MKDKNNLHKEILKVTAKVSHILKYYKILSSYNKMYSFLIYFPTSWMHSYSSVASFPPFPLLSFEYEKNDFQYY